MPGFQQSYAWLGSDSSKAASFMIASNGTMAAGDVGGLWLDMSLNGLGQ